MWDVSATIALLGSAFVFAYLYINAEEEQSLIRMLYLVPALVFCFSAVAMQTDVIESQAPTVNSTAMAAVQSSYEAQMWIFRVVLVVIVFSVLYKLLMLFVGNARRRREEDGMP